MAYRFEYVLVRMYIYVPILRCEDLPLNGLHFLVISKDSLKVIVYSTTDTMGLKTKVYISIATIVDVVLIQHIIKALVKVLQVEQDHCSSSLHTNFNLVDVSTNLSTATGKT